jgi:hypothetical protein
MRYFRYFLLALLVEVPSFSAARRSKRKESHPNILFITMDTTRADHLSCYGYGRRTSPNIDRLAASGVLFKNAYTAEPLTGPSHISMMTSLYPQQHGAAFNGMHMATHPRPVTLAQILHHLGYKTAAFVSAWPLRRKITGLGKGFGKYNQNFSYHYEMINAARRGDKVGKASRKWLRRNAHSPFFLWVHYFDPHSPYELHSEYARLPLVPNPPIPVATGIGKGLARTLRAYDSEIAFDDDDIGKTIDLLDQLGLRDHTLIVFAADHGESLGEHGYWGYGDHIYQPIIHVPLIVSEPGVIPAGLVSSGDVSLLDIMPTILDYADFGISASWCEGRSLRPLIEGGSWNVTPRPVYVVGYVEPPLLRIRWLWRWASSRPLPSHIVLIEGHQKFVLNGTDGPSKSYRLDPHLVKEEPLSGTPTELAGLPEDQEQVSAWFKGTNRNLRPEGEMSREDLEMLRSLGYVGTNK